MKLVKTLSLKDFQEDSSLISLFKLNQKTRQSLIRFFGAYLANCTTMRFKIMQIFVIGEVIDKREVRQSFVQEIL